MNKALHVTGLNPRESLAINARQILQLRMAEYYAYAPIVDQEFAIEELHNLRVAAKRLRYTLELFASVFGEGGERNIDRVKAIQEELGNIHDTDVRFELIIAELRDLTGEQLDATGQQLLRSPHRHHQAILTAAMRPPPDDPRRGLYALLSRQAVERHRAYLTFARLWKQLDSEGMRAELVGLSRDETLDSTLR